MQDAMALAKVIREAIYPLITKVNVDQDAVLLTIHQALVSGMQETKLSPASLNAGVSKTVNGAATSAASLQSASVEFDVAGDQPVKNMPATPKIRAQVRMGRRD